MCEVINASSGLNTATRDKFPKAVIPRTFDVGFTTGLMTKDVMLALAEADFHKMSMTIGNAVKATWLQALAKEGAGSDLTDIVKMMEEAAGVTVGRAKG
jgi:3-hydroxyisobutyrate dehydrogenase-like beta-hydroxyacid dehydrogenase